MDLTTLPFAELESLWDDCQRDGNYPLQERLVAEMMTRPDAAPESYDLLWEMQDLGWGGGVTQEDRDAR